MNYLLYNKDCFDAMADMVANDTKADIILTSPPYNTGRPSTSEKSRNNHEGRYDMHLDTMTQEEYIKWSVDLFKSFDTVLQKDGVILYNISYGSDGTVNSSSVGLLWLVIADIIRNTDFTVADRIVWKKKCALPNNVSKNKLTRICEDVFVFVRKDEYSTFNCNKTISGTSETGQTFYNNINNFIEAKNNDGSCDLNKATFSSELVQKLLYIYAQRGMLVYDPFNGTGTTAVGCYLYGCDCIGSELSTAQCNYSVDRLSEISSGMNGLLYGNVTTIVK